MANSALDTIINFVVDFYNNNIIKGYTFYYLSLILDFRLKLYNSVLYIWLYSQVEVVDKHIYKYAKT